MRLLLISTYELGRQPIHLASPLAALTDAGHEARAVDVAVEGIDPELVDWADAVAISVPMHTAKRMADALTSEMKRRRSELPVAHYGLYAGVGFVEHGPVDAALEGEYEPGLLGWVDHLQQEPNGSSRRSSHLGRSEFHTPDRQQLPGLDRYARLEHNGSTVPAAAVEASHGCRHRCRHCPIPVVYDGRIRIVPKDVVLADVDQVVGAGAGHVSFGDPDFLNAPAHSLAILEEAHTAHPEVTFDVTVKVEHILKHRDAWGRLAEQGLLFVVSAFESTDDPTLGILGKGHTREDMIEAVSLLRASDIHIRPTWLPFVPWTTTDQVADIFRFIVDHDLAAATDPVQMAIKLLIPRGSLLEDHPAVVPHLTSYDDSDLTWRWEFADPEVEALQKELERIAAAASDCSEEVGSTLQRMWDTVCRQTGANMAASIVSDQSVPRLTESWFCCAEPTAGQKVGLQLGPRPR